MNSRDVTVAVATCGRPDGLARCLNAIAAGHALPGELVVVDQAPTDLARRATERVDAVATRYIEQPRLGLSASRNLALSVSTLPVVAVTDDDCVPDADWLSAIVAAFEREPAPAAVTGAIEPFGLQPPETYSISLRSARSATDFHGRVIPWTVGSGANFAAPRELLVECNGWDERLGTGTRGMAAEDADLMYRILRAGGTIRYEPAAIVRHEWQTRARRLATRWSYGFGVGAMCGLWLRRREWFAARMLARYAGNHLRALARATVRRRPDDVSQHVRAVASLGPGVFYGLRAGPRSGS